MKHLYFNQLENNDIVWVVYNQSYQNNIYDFSQIIFNDILVKGTILENISIIRTRDLFDRYEESNPIQYEEMFMKISVNGLDDVYERFYDSFYNEKGQMTITPNFKNHGPIIEVFSTEESAKEYIIQKSKTSLDIINQKINNYKKQQENLLNIIKKYE